MKTWMPKNDEADRKWWLVDAADQNLGRLATRIASLIRGKHKPTFAPHVDGGDFVVVINADKIKFTGNKWTEKTYYRHSRYFGSLKTTSAEEMLKAHPTRIIEFAVKGMLPKNKLARHLITKLKAYAGTEHPHQAQKPEALTLN